MLSSVRHTKYIKELITTEALVELSADSAVLFGFVTLLVDIQYRVINGREIELDNGKGYSSSMLDLDPNDQTNLHATKGLH